MHSILVVKPSSLGDIVHTLPAVSFVRRAWPRACLRWVVNPEWQPLLEGNTDIDEVIVFPRRELMRIPGWLGNLRKRYRSDLVLDFQGLFRSAVMGRFARGGKLLGLSDAREGARFFYDQRVPVGREHAVERYLKLVAALGIDTTGPLTWNLPAGRRPEGFDLPDGEPFILLHPFARGKGKSLTPQQALELADALPCRVIMAGRTSEDICHSLLNQTSIPELIWLIRRAKFVISVDSGPLHIAAALTPNLLAIHTWSDPALVGPYRPEAWVWRGGELFQMQAPSSRKLAPNLQAVASHVAAFL